MDATLYKNFLPVKFLRLTLFKFYNKCSPESSVCQKPIQFCYLYIVLQVEKLFLLFLRACVQSTPLCDEYLSTMSAYVHLVYSQKPECHPFDKQLPEDQLGFHSFGVESVLGHLIFRMVAC